MRSSQRLGAIRPGSEIKPPGKITANIGATITTGRREWPIALISLSNSFTLSQ